MSKYNFPRQSIPRSKKTEEWRKDCIKFADTNTLLSSSLVRRTVAHKKINYDLLSGKLDMDDLQAIVNSEGIDYGVPLTKIQHYPVMNDKIMLLLGEERDSRFDFKVVITNPSAVSEIEENKKEEIKNALHSLIANTSLSEEEYNNRVQALSKDFKYNYQDLREQRANYLINHYRKELNFDSIFNDGFVDVLAVNEEIYQCYINGEEPALRKLNPLKVHVYGSGYSNKIEDADMIVIEDYWSLGKILDIFSKDLSAKDIKRLEDFDRYRGGNGDEYGDYGDPRNYFRFGDYKNSFDINDEDFISFHDGITSHDLPYDIAGNIRVLQVYWKSIKRIKEVKSYNPETGDAEYNYFTEEYICNKDLGEEEKIHYVNEAWEGTMIGAGEDAIFVNMRPCPVQYNSMSNPSKCHFGIIGSIYNFNESQPYSMVDMMKPLQYMYNATADKLNKLLARNIGKIIQLNLSLVPEGWTVDKWLYYAKMNGIAVIDPMKEGNVGVAKGKMAGMFNMPTTIDTELGNSIQNMIQLLEYIKNQMSEITGITKQRQGQISNRETVGGVERSTLQSSHTTRWYFAKHNDTKKRVIEAFLELAKVTMKGKTKKFQYILPDHSQQLLTIEGDDFAECDYGLVVDDGYDTQALNQEIAQIAQAAMQNSTLTFSTYLKIKANCSMADKIRMIEQEEQARMEQAQQAQQQQQKLAEQQMQQQASAEQAELELKNTLNERDNETKLLIANMQALAQQDQAQNGIIEKPIERDKLNEQLREFDAKLKLEYDKLKFEEEKLTKTLKAKNNGNK
jgi:hypothetical protein